MKTNTSEGKFYKEKESDRMMNRMNMDALEDVTGGSFDIVTFNGLERFATLEETEDTTIDYIVDLFAKRAKKKSKKS